MFSFIDSIPWWVDGVALAIYALGCLHGRRWARVKLQAKCDARNCDTLIQMRTERMKESADKLKVEQVFDFMRSQLRDKDTEIHGLKSTNGKLGKQIQSLTYQIPRQTRRLVA